MTTSRFYTSKRGAYLQFGNEFFQFKNNCLTPISEDQLKQRISLENGWENADNCLSVEDVKNAYLSHLNKEKEARMERNAKIMERVEAERAVRYNKALEIIKNQPIEANEENLSLVLFYLNEQNWGGWNLPQLTVGYSANQYDCDGSVATTITLDKPIMIDGELISKFKTGGKRGHLNNYRSL